MTVTQAQIEAASIAIADIYNVRLRDCTVSVAYELARGQAIEWAKAAITAAAQVGEPILQLKYTDKDLDDTIERCAQVADKYASDPICENLAAAIRNLKDAP